MLRKSKNNNEFEDGQAELYSLHFSLLKVPMLCTWHSLHLIIDFKLTIDPFRACASYFRY